MMRKCCKELLSFMAAFTVETAVSGGLKHVDTVEFPERDGIVKVAGVCDDRCVELQCDTLDINEYRRYAQFAKEIGATHMAACQVEPSMWQWDAAQNRKDPYPNWSMHRPTIFKFVVPDGLKPYLDTDYAARNLSRLRARAKVLDEYDLKASFMGQEPAYFPERAYLDHPNWRGPRCDQCRRARTEYYAPCVDDPEVRELYRQGMEMLCREIKLEKFTFMSNDSGAGFCWYPGLYPGENGPSSCKKVPISDRIVGFMSLLQKGAADGGVLGLKVNLSRYCRQEILETALPKLRPGQSILNRTVDKATATRIIGFPNPYAENSYPVFAMPRMVEIVRQLQTAEDSPDDDVSITLRSFEEIDTLRLLRTYWGKRKIGQGLMARIAALREIAVMFVGDEAAERLVKIWTDYEDVCGRWDWAATGGHMFLLGTTHQRWLTRPLVCFPEELKPEEKRYYRDYQFQAGTEAEADDLVNLQAYRWLGGYGGSFAVSRTWTMTAGLLAEGAKSAQELVAFAKDDESTRYLKGLSLKLALYRAIGENAVHAVAFQNLVDEGKARISAIGEPRDWHAYILDQEDPAFSRANRLIRDEIDTTLRIIDILERARKERVTVIRTAERDEFTNVMNLPPVDRLIGELKKKISVMEAHRRDVTRLYRSNNR